MPLKTSQAEELPGVNLTPMIDVVFLLIIFFMVGTKFTESQQQIAIKLPGVGGLEPLVSPPDRREVSIAKDGTVALDAQPVALEELTRRLTAMRVQFPRLSVVFNGDGAAPYQRIMDAMGAVKRAGVTDVTLGARTQQPTLR
jgi:biopolymer transport protein ExbD